MVPPSKNKLRQHNKPPRSKSSTSDVAVKGEESSTKSVSVAQSSPHHLVHHALPVNIQQYILSIFSDNTLLVTQDQTELKRAIQEVKGHLYNRDFLAAFGQPRYLRAYAVRWSAARALGYTNIFTHSDRQYLFPNPSNESEVRTRDSPVAPTPQPSMYNAVCVGGGAGAEIVALNTAYRLANPSGHLKIMAVDIADWTDVVSSLSTSIAASSCSSIHADETSRHLADSHSFLRATEQVSVSFTHQDILCCAEEVIRETFSTADLCTIMFTLNELFSTSLPKTTALLLGLTEAMQPGTHLLVVDSPGSYSEIRVGKNEQETIKKYPMKWLLDHTLLEVARGGKDLKWEKIEEQDSAWFRIDATKLRYPVDLENMRYQIHIYRRK